MLEKRAKKPKDKIKLIRSFLNGEDIAGEFLEPITRFVVIDTTDPSWSMTEQEEVGVLYWREKRTYADPEIEGVRYANKENVPISDLQAITAHVSENVDYSEVSDITERKAKLRGLLKDIEADNIRRENMVTLGKANASLVKTNASLKQFFTITH